MIITAEISTPDEDASTIKKVPQKQLLPQRKTACAADQKRRCDHHKAECITAIWLCR